MFCRHCGKELPDAAKFCKWCGEELKESAEDRYETACMSETAQPSVSVQPASLPAQTKLQSSMAETQSHEEGVVNDYIDKLKDKLANTQNPLLRGRSLKNLAQAVCWVCMCFSFFIPFIALKKTKYTEPDSYSGVGFLSDLFTNSFGERSYAYDSSFMFPMVALFVLFFIMLFFLGKLIYQNKNTIKSNRRIIVWSCVDLAFQILIFWFVIYSNDQFNKAISSKSTYTPYEAGFAVYLSVFAVVIIITVTVCAINDLKSQEQKN